MKAQRFPDDATIGEIAGSAVRKACRVTPGAPKSYALVVFQPYSTVDPRNPDVMLDGYVRVTIQPIALIPRPRTPEDPCPS